MHVFFDTECTQDLARDYGSFGHIPNLICAQQMCSKCQAMDDMQIDCDQCGKRTHVIWEDQVANLLIISGCIDHSRTRFVISHNSRGYDAQFLLRRLLELKWKPELVMDGTKILSMTVDHLQFLDSLNFLPMSLKSMPKSFDLTCKKGYYPHFFNTAKNLDYVGPYLEPVFYGADYMLGDE